MKLCEDPDCILNTADYYCWNCDQYLCEEHANFCKEKNHEVTEVAE